MKKFALTASAVLFGAGMAAADPVEGVWKTQPGDTGNYGLVTISMCGEQVCGVLGQGYDSAGNEVDSPNIGRKMIWDMNVQGGGEYAGGKIWAPDRDRTYKSKMSLSGDTLKVSGCVAIICRSQTWSRVQ